MTRRERLMRVLRGGEVDRTPVCFYELNGIDQDPDNPDPFNIFNHPSWGPLIQLTREKTDCIVLRNAQMKNSPPNPQRELWTVQKQMVDGNLVTSASLRAGDRLLTCRSRRDPAVNTVWTVEHLLKDIDDLSAWLALPQQPFGGEPDVESIIEAERQLGDAGIVALDTPDPLCVVAGLFDMGTYTVIALTEPELFHAALEKVANTLLPCVEAVAQALPGRLWRIYGPEYAAPPYLPPRLFEEYVVKYDRQMIGCIHKYGGCARVHSHGRLRAILPHICAMGAAGLDPVEPPPQGDVDLSYVRENYGRQLVIFGNLEVSDIETLPARQFEQKVLTALREGPGGRGFVLQPSASPYGRVVTDTTLRNYERMVELAEKFAHQGA